MLVLFLSNRARGAQETPLVGARAAHVLLSISLSTCHSLREDENQNQLSKERFCIYYLILLHTKCVITEH